MIKNALTINLEDWYQTRDINIDMKIWANCEDRVEESVEVLLNVLKKGNVKATFFVLGYVAENHPELIRKISDQGHEMGCQGYSDKLIIHQTRNGFREDVRTSKHIIEDIIGKEVNAYRAYGWSITKKTLWALPILEEEGFCCDSSIKPFTCISSGISGAPLTPYHPIVNNKKLKLVEYPPSVYTLAGLKIPFSGGIYFRSMPISFIKRALKKLNRKTSGMIYIHSWEIDQKQPKLSLMPLPMFTHYHNIDTTIDKVQTIAEDFDMVPIKEIVEKSDYPYMQI